MEPREHPGELRRVIAVARAVRLASGGTLYVTAIEIWDRRVTIHSAEHLPEYFPPGRPIPENRPLWMLSDDVGTAYVPMGGQSGGTQSHRQSTYDFGATVPVTATELMVAGPGMAAEETMVVDLV